MVLECLICCERVNFMSVGQCNHKVVCLKCCLKMRSISKNTKCIYCNEELPQVAIVDDEEVTFQEIEIDMKEFRDGIYYTSQRTKGACIYLDRFQCPIENCHHKDYFTKYSQYKIHLEKEHKRFLCELCVDNKTLLMNEHQTFTAFELKQHLDKGDFDKENNLTMLHPFCLFCEKHYFSDDEFKNHLNKKHEKCFLCKNSKYKYIYYRDYPSLSKHFEASHYACEEPQCIQKGFQAFKTREELEKHNKQVHTKGQTKKKLYVQNFSNNADEDVIFDNEGVDISEWLLSEKKRNVEVLDESKCIKRYNEPIDNMRLFIHLIADGNVSVQDEQQIIKTYYINRKQGQAPKSVCLEDIKFEPPNKKNQYNLKIFQDEIRKILRKPQIDNLHLIIQRFFQGQLEPQNLFHNFLDIFGPNLGYKYFHRYILTLQGTKRETLNLIFKKEVSKLYYKNKNILYDTPNWKEFFHKIRDEIAENVLYRIKKQRLDTKKKYILSSGRIFQMIGTIKQMNFKEAVQFKYLGNFLHKRNNLTFLQTSLTIFFKKSQQILDKISNVDILSCFIYFNLIILRFENKEKITNAQRINPNLLKLFLRHYPDLAKDISYDLESDDEDYTQQNKIDDTNEHKGTVKEIVDAEERIRSKYQTANLTQVFAQNEVHINPEDKYEFPDLEGIQNKQKLDKQQEVGFQENGWNDLTDQYLFSTNKKQTQRLQEEFPDLEVVANQDSRLNFGKTKPPKIEKHKPKLAKVESNPFEEDKAQNERNILSGLNKKHQSDNIMMVKKKKKKKKQ